LSKLEADKTRKTKTQGVIVCKIKDREDPGRFRRADIDSAR